MSPSMPINITILASPASSTASSPSSSSSSSRSGVYIPVHKRARSDPVASEPKRTLPVYTPAELMQLAQSPLSRHLSAATHAALHAQEELAVIALSKRQQRSREYIQRRNDVEHVQESKNNLNTVAAVAPRRRPVGRAAERSSGPNSRRNVAASRFMDAASWRGPTRHMEALPVSLAV